MQRVIRSILSCTLFAFVVAPVTAQDFEGVVTMSMNIPNMGMAVEMTHTAKAGKVRSEVNMMGQQMITVIDSEAGTGLVLMPAMQAYMRMDLKEAMANANQGQEDQLPSIEATGQTETIAGHQCEHYNVTVNQNVMDMCVAKDLGFFSGSMGMGGGQSVGGLQGANSDVWRELFEDGFFPLSISMTQNAMQISMQVTNIERRSVSDDLFNLEIPDGYTEMPGVLGGGRGGGGA